MKDNILNFGLVGFNHTLAPIEIREKLAVLSSDYKKYYELLKPYCEDLFILSTCNRLEIYFLAKQDFSGEILESFLTAKNLIDKKNLAYCLIDNYAISHLWQVASGLDSLVLGETQILGQIKEAFNISCQIKQPSAYFLKILESSYSVAKKIRSETNLAKNPTSVGKIAMILAKQVLRDSSNHNILLIGAGEVAENALVYLKNQAMGKLTVCNRTLSKALEIAEKYNADITPFESLNSAILAADMVIGSIDIKEPILSGTVLLNIMKQRRFKPLFFIDLGLPRNFDANIAKIDNCYLFNIDDLQNLAKENEGLKKQEASVGYEIIKNELENFINWQSSFSSRGDLAQFRKDFFNRYFLALDQLLKQNNLEPERVKKEINQLFNRILHQPTKYLQALDGNSGKFDLLYEIFDLKPAKIKNNIIPIKIAKKAKAGN